MDRKPEDVVDIAKNDDNRGYLHFVGKAGSNFNLLVFGNVLIQLDGSAPSDDIKKLAQTIDEFVKTYEKDNAKTVLSPNDVEVTKPGEVQVGDIFEITVKVRDKILCHSR
jgi:hypothetical protein